MLDVLLDSMHTPLKIDYSTGDIITPHEVTYDYPLMFEERTISILAYNLETLLAEKIHTLLARGTLNTRMRDFYDIFVIYYYRGDQINTDIVIEAIRKTCLNRNSSALLKDTSRIVAEVAESGVMMDQWKKYQINYDYASAITWQDIMNQVIGITKFVR